VAGGCLDWMISEVFSNAGDSTVVFYSMLVLYSRSGRGERRSYGRTYCAACLGVARSSRGVPRRARGRAPRTCWARPGWGPPPGLPELGGAPGAASTATEEGGERAAGEAKGYVDGHNLSAAAARARRCHGAPPPPLPPSDGHLRRRATPAAPPLPPAGPGPVLTARCRRLTPPSRAASARRALRRDRRGEAASEPRRRPPRALSSLPPRLPRPGPAPPPRTSSAAGRAQAAAGAARPLRQAAPRAAARGGNCACAADGGGSREHCACAADGSATGEHCACAMVSRGRAPPVVELRLCALRARVRDGLRSERRWCSKGEAELC